MRCVNYIVRENPRARRINITVRRDGSVFVTKPRRVSTREVEKFVRESGEWIERMRERFSKLPKTSKIEPSKKEYNKFKRTARDEVARRLEHFTKFYGFSYRRLSIRNQKSRWGSCSRRGDISINYRILFLPPHLADYILVHEICHLQELNHSKRFWELVGKASPDYRERRKELRKFERGLLTD